MINLTQQFDGEGNRINQSSFVDTIKDKTNESKVNNNRPMNTV